MKFVGRKPELAELNGLWKKSTASLITCIGRRRIGKSTLIEYFALQSGAKFIAFQGLAPREATEKKIDQLTHFLDQFETIFEPIQDRPTHWSKAFAILDKKITNKKTVILFDEISWMSHEDSDFPGKIKVAWDTLFKKHPKLIVCLCGSVSSWIENNISKNSDFVGRLTWSFDLKELLLPEINQFWNESSKISYYEKVKLLSLTGGIPRYLEELRLNETAEQNIGRLFFKKGAPLYSDFEKIFNDLFNRKAPIYKKILNCLVTQKLSLKNISDQLKLKKSGTLSQYLSDLIIAGFIDKIEAQDFSGKKKREITYRLRDNYIRFYLKYVQPRKEKIEQGLFEFQDSRSLPNYESILGLQFETLVLNNLSVVIKALNIMPNMINQARPYFQKKNSKNKGGVQIDLLIETTEKILYLIEIKLRKQLGVEVIHEMKQKMKILEYPRYYSLRPVLIYEGHLAEEVRNKNFFETIINGEELFDSSHLPK